MCNVSHLVRWSLEQRALQMPEQNTHQSQSSLYHLSSELEITVMYCIPHTYENVQLFEYGFWLVLVSDQQEWGGV